jgi:TetR/AcrR family transcriptional regulator, regulator of cefoperazone and chloramphenicol sensitivity
MTVGETKSTEDLEPIGQIAATRIRGRTGRSIEGEGHDLTARIRIRDAALKHFAEEGYERTTIRAIARTAGVSHGMLRHHYGSKIDLRAGCDDYVFQVLHRLNTVLLDVPSGTEPSLQSPKPLWRYAARTLAEGSPTAGPIFDEIVILTARRMVRSGNVDSTRKDDPHHKQAALLAAMASAIPLFQEHLSRTLGIDIFSFDGDTLITLALRDLFTATTHDDVASSDFSTTPPTGRPTRNLSQ